MRGEPAVVFGNGYGSFIALMLALRHPALVTRLILAGTGAAFSEPGRAAFRGDGAGVSLAVTAGDAGGARWLRACAAIAGAGAGVRGDASLYLIDKKNTPSDSTGSAASVGTSLRTAGCIKVLRQ